MIRIDCIWLALGASDLRGGIDKLLAQVVHGFALAHRPTTPTCLPTGVPTGSRYWCSMG
jgi:hypothetical protein